MKTFKICLMIAFLSLAQYPIQSRATEAPVTTVTTTTTITEEPVSAEMQVMLDRLNEINAMDKSNLSFSEKRELRREVKAIKKSMAEHTNGVYISVGAAIIIVLLLILIF